MNSRIAKLGITLLLTLTHAMSCIFPIIGTLIAFNINVLIPFKRFVTVDIKPI